MAKPDFEACAAACSAGQRQVLKSDFMKIEEINPENFVVALQKDTRQNLQYSRYICAGARRIGAASSNERDFDSVAFVNRNGSHTMVVVARNTGTTTISGLGRRLPGFLRTGRQKRIAPGPIHVKPGPLLSTKIPGPGVLTVFAADSFER